MNKKIELIEAIEAEKYEVMIGEGVMESAHNYAMDKAIDLINSAFEGKVLVPIEIIESMESIYESGFEPNEQIEQLIEIYQGDTVKVGGNHDQ